VRLCTVPSAGLQSEFYDSDRDVVTAYDPQIGLISSHLSDEPLLLDVDNGTVAGYVARVAWGHGTVGPLPVSANDPGFIAPIM
jgi:hypothetical protein